MLPYDNETHLRNLKAVEEYYDRLIRRDLMVWGTMGAFILIVLFTFVVLKLMTGQC